MAASERTLSKGERLREQVLDLHKQGLDRYEIAEAIGKHESSARRYASQLGITLRAPRNTRWVEADQIRAEVRRLNSQGLYVDQIAKAVNRSESRIKNYATEMGIKLNHRPAASVLNRMTRIEEAKVLFKQEKSLAEVGAILGITPRQALRYKSRLKMTDPTTTVVPEDVLSSVREMMKDKAPPSEIVATLNVGEKWLFDKFPDYRYREFSDVYPTNILIRAFNSLPDTLQPTRLPKFNEQKGKHASA